MSAREPGPGPAARTARPGGVPDGALVAVLGVLMGGTAAVWAATAVAAAATRGGAPHPLPFTATPAAVVRLATAPGNLPHAWPNTPPGQLPSAQAFWTALGLLLALVLCGFLALLNLRRRLRRLSAARRQGDVGGGSGDVGGGGVGSGGVGSGGSAVAYAEAGQGTVLIPADGTPGVRLRIEVVSGAAPDPAPAPAAPPVALGKEQAAVPTHLRQGPADGGSETARVRGPGVPPSVAAAWAEAPPMPDRPPLTHGQAGPTFPSAPTPAPAPAAASASASADTLVTPVTTTQLPGQPGPARPSAPHPAPPAIPAPGPAPAGVPAPTAEPPGFGPPLPSGTLCLVAREPGGRAARRRLLTAVAAAAPGPLVVVTADAELWRQRPRHRNALLYDPLHLADEGERAAWMPHRGCQDPATARQRARALLAPAARTGTDPAERTVQSLAETVLTWWLHAAALDGRPFRHVHRWASGSNRSDPVRILQRAEPPNGQSGQGGQTGQVGRGGTDDDPHAPHYHPGESPAAELQAALLVSADLREPALERIDAVLAAVAELHVLAACTPADPRQGIDPAELLRGPGALYLLGRPEEGRVRPGRPSTVPLLTALVQEVADGARRAAARTGGGRLEPPLTLLLDDIAAVAPFPGLPELMGRGGPRGLDAVAVLRSPEQAVDRWGDHAVHSLWTAADHRALLGPLAGPETTTLLAALRPAPARPGAASPGAGGTGTNSAEPAAREGTGLRADELLLVPSRGPGQLFRIS